MKKLSIGLFGFGVVGEGIYQVLRSKPQLQSTIKKICIKHPGKARNAPDPLFTTDAAEILDDPEIDVIVELIDDADAAFTIAKAALARRKPVVTANKKMVAGHLTELIELQKKNNVSLLYEAAVCGSIPIVRNLEEYFDNDLLASVSGIVNGSTNFILTQMNDAGKSFGEALDIARRVGFAESNPILDLQGIDAAYKVSIIALHAFGKILDPDLIVRKGITSLTAFDFQYAREKNASVKLIASSIFDEEISAPVTMVIPTFVQKECKLSSVNNEYNGVLVESSLFDSQFFYGKGAGRFPTSSAVLSDISALRYDYRYEYKKGACSKKVRKTLKAGRFYLGFKKETQIDPELFDTIDESYKNHHHQYITGKISFEKLKEFDFWKNEDVSLIQMELPED